MLVEHFLGKVGVKLKRVRTFMEKKTKSPTFAGEMEKRRAKTPFAEIIRIKEYAQFFGIYMTYSF